MWVYKGGSFCLPACERVDSGSISEGLISHSFGSGASFCVYWLGKLGVLNGRAVRTVALVNESKGLENLECKVGKFMFNLLIIIMYK